MINTLLQLDRQLFFFINHLPHNLLLNLFFGILTASGYLGIIWFVLGYILSTRSLKKNKMLMKGIILNIIVSLLLGELFLKNYFGRLRPQFNIPTIILPFDYNWSFSFPSGHATSSFACAYFLSSVDKKNRFFYFSLAILISFSRIYLGKHYPSDVLVGMLFGLVIGYISRKTV